jgi:hypothetical protein
VKRFGGGLRVDALVAGKRYVQRVPSAAVSARTPRTLISTRLASDVADAPGPQRCSRLPWFGKVCGISTRVAVALPNCRAVKVRAVALPLPRGADLIIGQDVLGRVQCRRDKR